MLSFENFASMDEPVGAQYALQVALQTLKERCQKFQQRIGLLEEENLSLRIQCSKHDNAKSSLSEISLKEKVAELAEQKDQLQNKIKLVTSENQELWTRLSKLTRVNKNLGTHLLKINETLTQHSKNNHVPLVRSKTFTQDQPQTEELKKNLEENGRISLELEDISLKLMNSIAKEKNELETLCMEISEMQCNDIITNSFSLNYDDEFDDVLLEDFNSVVQDWLVLKKLVSQQRDQLNVSLQYISKMHEHTRSKKKELNDKSTSTTDYLPSPDNTVETKPKTHSKETSTDEQVPPTEASDKICPICTVYFDPYASFQEFEQHVESHFLDENFELL